MGSSRGKQQFCSDQNPQQTCGFWTSQPKSSNSMEGISDLLRALSDEMVEEEIEGLSSSGLVTTLSELEREGGNKSIKIEVGRMQNHPGKRNRTPEMHNMTERKRREKIKGKLKELQQLIPNSEKMDRASMLDEAISYMKSLQQQVQMMGAGSRPTYQPQFMPVVSGGMNYSVTPSLMYVQPPSPVGRVFPAPGMGQVPAGNRPMLPMQQVSFYDSQRFPPPTAADPSGSSYQFVCQIQNPNTDARCQTYSSAE